MDLLEDLNGILQMEFKKSRYHTQEKDTHDLLIGLFNLQNKTVSIKRRNVHISNELRTKEVEQPYDGYLKQIRNKFKNGKNINPYLSEKSVKPQQKDPLLYDWGIHHLHLNNNNKLNNKGFVKRSDYILFFVLKEDDVYFIDVTKHKLEDKTEFSQQYLLGIIKRNWPHLLASFKLKGITPSKTDDKKHSLLRASGASAVAGVDGESFGLIGGGITAAKTNLAHTIKADEVLIRFRNLEDDLRKGVTGDFNGLANEMDFKLILENKTFYIVESHSENKVLEAEGLYDHIFGHLNEL